MFNTLNYEIKYENWTKVDSWVFVNHHNGCPVGYVSLVQISKIETTFDEVENKTTPAIIALGEMKSNLFFILLETSEYVLEPNQEHLSELS